MTNNQYTAAILIIGNEILSGKVKERNSNFIASRLFTLGITLKEIIIIPDDESIIISKINELTSKYTYIFTTGGIGPTHDDITSASIAKAFNVKLVRHEEAVAKIKAQYSENHDPVILEEAFKMADIPQGADLITNDISGAPGYKIKNVFVMAGIPEIMQSMFHNLQKQYLPSSSAFFSRSINVSCGETKISKHLRDLQNEYSTIQIGSYPFKENDRWFTNIVASGVDEIKINSFITQFTLYLRTNKINFEVDATR